MKRLLFLLLTLSFSYLSYSQTVENIRVEPDGDNIKINFRIGGSTESQLYNVYLTCSIDGGPRFEPKTVIGDAGKNIRGGKSFYTILWDVFADLDEIGNAEFFVRVELVSDPNSPVKPIQNQPRDQSQRPPTSTERVKPISQTEVSSSFKSPLKPSGNSNANIFSRKFYMAYSGSTYNHLGFGAGTLGNWGVYASFRLGIYVEIYDLHEGTLVGGMTKFIVAKEKFRIHAYAGGGLANFLDSFTMETGATSVIGNRLNLSLGFSYTPNVWFSETGVGDLVFGIGFVL